MTVTDVCVKTHERLHSVEHGEYRIYLALFLPSHADPVM